MNPVAIRSQYGDLYGSSMLPVLEELFRAEIALHPSRREQLFKVVQTDRDIWQSSELHDLDLFNEVPEGQDYTFKRAKQGANKTLSISKYGLGFSISEEAVEDGKFDMIADLTRRLARSGMESQEIQAMDIINNGFNSETTADGRPVFDTGHTLPSGLTFRNELASAADLSATSLEQMLLDFETQFVGDTGIIYNIKPRLLLVHPSNRRLAEELLGSELKPDVFTNSVGTTNINNINSFRSEGLTWMSSPHISDSDSWFMMAAPEETGLRLVIRKAMETKAAGPDVGFASDSILYKSRYREAKAAIHAYGVFGTPGSG